jgi:hypothetical protein
MNATKKQKSWVIKNNLTGKIIPVRYLDYNSALRAYKTKVQRQELFGPTYSLIESNH